MKKLLYQIHRWAGVALALFMFVWFCSGLVIMYAPPSALTATQQLRGHERLDPQPTWLSLGAAWQASSTAPSSASIAQARLVQLDGLPYWLIETNDGHQLALSGLDGAQHRFSPLEAALIGANWLRLGDAKNAEPLAEDGLSLIDTGPSDSAVRGLEKLAPFHRFSVGNSGRELLISSRTGEVVRDSTPLQRALYWCGNWIHLLRFLDDMGLDQQRASIQAWLGGIAFAACLTGLIIGWQRWRPGWAGRPTYSQGRKHPYRDAWNTWHFWTGLIGGSAALLWALSGYLSTNPFAIFSPANANAAALIRYRGAFVPSVMLNWQPKLSAEAKLAHSTESDLVELAWHRLGQEAVLVGVARNGMRVPQTLAGASARFDTSSLLAAVVRLTNVPRPGHVDVLKDYDNYYYPRHHQGALERPLPVLRVSLDDRPGTRVYIDPLDGQLLLKQDSSRRAYRWLYSALHHWDLPGLYRRPLWDLWMLPLVLMGLVLGSTAVVLGVKRLRIKFKPKQRKSTADQAANQEWLAALPNGTRQA